VFSETLILLCYMFAFGDLQKKHSLQQVWCCNAQLFLVSHYKYTMMILSDQMQNGLHTSIRQVQWCMDANSLSLPTHCHQFTPRKLTS